jgi:hypothetical protein
MGAFDGSMYPGGANYPANPDSQYSDIAKLMQLVNAGSGTPAPSGDATAPNAAPSGGSVVLSDRGNNPNDIADAMRTFETRAAMDNPGPSEEDINAAHRRKLVGMIGAALAGGLINKGTHAGGGAGAASAVSAFDQNYSNATYQQRQQALQKRQEAVKGMLEIYKDRMKAKAGVDPMGHMTDLVKNFVATNGRMPNQAELVALNTQLKTDIPDPAKQYLFGKDNPGFTDWLDRNKGQESTPTDIKTFQALYPGVDVGSEKGRTSFLDLQSKLKSDPYLALAVATMNNDLGSMRMTPDQKIAAAQELSNKMRLNAGGTGSPAAPVIRYDRNGNRLP